MRLNIYQKILLIIAVAALGFVIYIFANVYTKNVNKENLNQLSNVQFPLVIETQSAKNLLRRIQDQLEQAVITGGAEQIDIAEKTKVELTESISNIRNLSRGIDT